ncbi:MAG: hypothetical protein PHX27_02590 [Candidatus ainarchaeum sp.]|nr:hypothetical protein [Candidatus ainarchaeum sp.]
MKNELTDKIDTAKRACLRCYKQKKHELEEKEIAKQNIRQAFTILNETYDKKRKDDTITSDQINSLKKAKTLCLDALEACETCSKEKPKIKEMLSIIK